MVFRELGRVWYSAELSVGLKLRIYTAAVLSVLTYGYEVWVLCPKVVSRLDSWNARRLAVITGREIRSEYTVPTFHLSAWLGARGLQWAGHLLRGTETSLVSRVARVALGGHCAAGGG